MLKPNYLLHISEGAENIAEQLHVEIVNRIVDRILTRIDRGEDYLMTATDKWQIEVLQDSGFLLEEIQQEIAKKTKLQEQEIKGAMEEAGVKALEYDDSIYRNAGLSPVPLMQSPHLIRIMQRNYEATLGEWNNFTRTTAEASQRTYINAMDKAYNLVTSGATSYTQAVKEVLQNAISDGVIVYYPTGHKDTLETATLRAVRTGISQMSAQVQLARMKEMGVALAITSSHLGARPTHEIWQGQVFSVDWEKMNLVYPMNDIPMPQNQNTSKYPDFIESTRIGKVDGLCGANCRHNFSVYFEGQNNPFADFDSEENRKRNELEIRQRELERRIRHTKREVMNWQKAVESAEDEKLKFENDLMYQKKSALLQKQNKAYNDFCEKNNLKRLSDRLEVAKWNREQAAKARGAAQRYNNAKK